MLNQIKPLILYNLKFPIFSEGKHDSDTTLKDRLKSVKNT